MSSPAVKKLMSPEAFGAVGRVVMPTTRVLYTVNQSPHVDKKSREQFEIRTKKHFMDIKVENSELHKKLFWLKRMRLFGAQFEIQMSSQTRLDKNVLEAYKQGKEVTHHPRVGTEAGILDNHTKGKSSSPTMLRIKISQFG